jgi:hypothetical protein
MWTLRVLQILFFCRHLQLLMRSKGQCDPSLNHAFGGYTTDIGNGDVSPEWGVDLIFYSTVIQYGPWADRQRLVC